MPSLPFTKKKQPKKLTEQQKHEQLGRMLTAIYESGYLDIKKSYSNSFIKGMLGGLGGVIGATVGVALLVWFLSFFNRIPFVDKVINTIDQSTQTSQQQSSESNQ